MTMWNAELEVIVKDDLGVEKGVDFDKGLKAAGWKKQWWSNREDFETSITVWEHLERGFFIEVGNPDTVLGCRCSTWREVLVVLNMVRVLVDLDSDRPLQRIITDDEDKDVLRVRRA